MSAHTATAAIHAGVRSLVVKVGAVSVVAAAGLVIYAVNGDPHPTSGQKSAVPALVVIDVVLAAVVFGLLLPRLLRNLSAQRARVAAVSCGVAAVLSIMVFWSGAPLVLGIAAATAGQYGRTLERRSRSFVAALILGILAVLLAVAATVLGNTVLSN